MGHPSVHPCPIRCVYFIQLKFHRSIQSPSVTLLRLCASGMVSTYLNIHTSDCHCQATRLVSQPVLSAENPVHRLLLNLLMWFFFLWILVMVRCIYVKHAPIYSQCSIEIARSRGSLLRNKVCTFKFLTKSHFSQILIILNYIYIIIFEIIPTVYVSKTKFLNFTIIP